MPVSKAMILLCACLIASTGQLGCSSAGPAAPVTVTVPASPPPPTTTPAPELPSPLPISEDDARIGPDDALVTVVLFGDIRSSWSTFLLERYETDYAPQFPPGALRFVWKHHVDDAWDAGPQREEAYQLAIAAAATRIAAGSETFFAFVKRAAATSSLTAKEREDLAVAVGASRERFNASLPAAKERVDADEAILKGLPYPGPHFYVNGASGNVRFSCDTPGTIAKELRLGKAAVSKGTPPDHVYAERARENVAQKAHCVLLKD